MMHFVKNVLLQLHDHHLSMWEMMQSINTQIMQLVLFFSWKLKNRMDASQSMD